MALRKPQALKKKAGFQSMTSASKTALHHKFGNSPKMCICGGSPGGERTPQIQNPYNDRKKVAIGFSSIATVAAALSNTAKPPKVECPSLYMVGKRVHDEKKKCHETTSLNAALPH